ncbi:MAG: 16S rRNA (uracil(1498)-N(3))-methyltransferase [Lachnospiraceae bacterium]|nr:16S rRNA (uracil(1498)-N(3))-methyltransferase [Lachnospiraceae bacterium]
MYQFFVEESQIHTQERRVLITGSDVNHIKNVLRMRPGEEISVSNGRDGRDYRCGILELTEDAVICELRFIRESSNELPVEVTLYQGLPKSDKLELIIQKCVELGVTRIVPVQTKRCIMKLDPKKEESKRARWQGIAEAAAKQSKRGIIPVVDRQEPFAHALEESRRLDLVLIPYELAEGMERTRALLGSVKPGMRIGIFIGPEGGFEEEEIRLAEASGAQPITLGKRILRTETAGMVVLGWLGYLTEGLEQE